VEKNLEEDSMNEEYQDKLLKTSGTSLKNFYARQIKIN